MLFSAHIVRSSSRLQHGIAVIKGAKYHLCAPRALSHTQHTVPAACLSVIYRLIVHLKREGMGSNDGKKWGIKGENERRSGRKI